MKPTRLSPEYRQRLTVSVHLVASCDHEHPGMFIADTTVEIVGTTRRKVKAELWKRGWRMNADGTVTCPECVAKGA